MTDKRWTMDLTKIKDVPGCRKEYKVGGSYCAVGKIFKALDIPIPPDVDTWFTPECEAAIFARAIQDKLSKSVNVDWIRDVANINDCELGDFKENHEKALDKAILLVMSTGLVEIKSEELVENMKELQGVAS
jgi:hypothetical protein